MLEWQQLKNKQYLGIFKTSCPISDDWPNSFVVKVEVDIAVVDFRLLQKNVQE